jgi:hypothetical protein
MTRSFVRAVGALILAAGVVISCDDDEEPTGPDLEIEEFTATLSGAKEIPANASTATGTATITRVGPTLLFRVDVTGLTNPSAAHIHAPADTLTNIGVRVNLCGATGVPTCPVGSPAGTPYTGVLATGTAVQVTGISFDSLLVLLRNGNAYVNVHTNDNTGAANTGPGDLQAGEIRGQVAVAP